MSHEPELLQSLITDVTTAVRRAWAEGYRQGAADAAERMMRAAGAVKPPAFVTSEREPAPLPESARRSPPRVGLGEESRGAYGAVIRTFRQAFLENVEAGMTREEIFTYCKERGIDLTVGQYRDTLKRMRGGEEVERHNGVYYAGRRLRGLNINGDMGPKILDVTPQDPAGS